MPVIGYKKMFKNIKGLEKEVFIINFNLEYNEHGFFNIKNTQDSYFDIGDFRNLIDEVFNEFTEEQLKEYNNGIYILSICKYIVDKIPNLYSIQIETDDMIDIYYKEEIISIYDKVKGK